MCPSTECHGREQGKKRGGGSRPDTQGTEWAVLLELVSYQVQGVASQSKLTQQLEGGTTFKTLVCLCLRPHPVQGFFLYHNRILIAHLSPLALILAQSIHATHKKMRLHSCKGPSPQTHMPPAKFLCPQPPWTAYTPPHVLLALSASPHSCVQKVQSCESRVGSRQYSLVHCYVRDRSKQKRPSTLTGQDQTRQPYR